MGKMKKFIKRLWKDRALVLMSMPVMIYLVMFHFIPISGLVMAFKRFDFSLGMLKSPWCGLDNIRFLFLSSGTFWRITRNTVLYYVIFTVFGTISQVALAIAINELIYAKAGKLIQSTLILPTFISYKAVSYVVSAFIAPNNGLLTKLIAAITGENVLFYLEADYWPFILTLVYLWKTVGYGSVIYLAVLTGIDQELYEAAKLDGATTWQRIRYITVPLMTSMIVIKMLLGLAGIMHSDTGLFYQVTKNTGALYETTQVLDSYLLHTIKQGVNFGPASAATLYQSIIGCILLLVVNGIVRKVSPEDALF